MHVSIYLVLTPRVGKAYPPTPKCEQNTFLDFPRISRHLEPGSMLAYTSPNQRQIVVDLKRKQQN